MLQKKQWNGEQSVSDISKLSARVREKVTKTAVFY